MSVDGDAARRDMWAGRIGRCLALGMAIGKWCSLNKVTSRARAGGSPSSATRDPGRSTGKNPETSGWVKAAREGVAAVKAIMPTVSAAGQAVADPAEETPGSKGRRSRKPLGAFSAKMGKLREVYRSARLFWRLPRWE